MCGCLDNKMYYGAEEVLTKQQEEKWSRILEEKGRIPHVPAVNFCALCALCGEVSPEMFTATEWSTFVPPHLHVKILCMDCYMALKIAMPNGWRNVQSEDS